MLNTRRSAYGQIIAWTPQLTHLTAGVYTLSFDASMDEDATASNRLCAALVRGSRKGNTVGQQYPELSAKGVWERLSAKINIAEEDDYLLSLLTMGNAASYDKVYAHFKRIQIEAGNTATEYEPYRE